MDDREERIRARAFELWLEAGSPDGRDHEFWYRAEQELAAEQQRSSSEGLETDDDVESGAA